MVRRLLNIIFLLLFMGAASYAGYKFFFENRGPNHDPIRAIPANAVAFLNGPDLVSFYRETDNTSLLWQDLKSSGLISTFDGQLDVWNTIDKKGALKNIGEIPFVLSLHTAGNHAIDYLLCVSIPGKSAETVNNLLKQGNINIEDYEGDIKKITSNKITWYYYSFENLAVFSPSFTLLQAARTECENPTEDAKFKGFYKLRPTIGDHVKSSFFVRNTEYIALLAPHFKSDLESMFTQYPTGAAGLYDVVIEPNSLLMRGFNWAPDSLNTSLGLLKDQKPIKPELVKRLPGNTQWFYYMGMSDFEKFVERYHDNPGVRQEIEAFNGSYNVNLKQHLLSWIDRELVYFTTAAFPHERLLLVKTDGSANPQKEIDFLNKQLDSSGVDNVNYNGKIIRRINESNLFALVLGDVFSKLDRPYYLQLDNTIVFGTSADALIDYVSSISQDHYLVRDIQFYDNLENYFSTATNVLFHTGFNEGNEAWRLMDSVKGNLLRDVSFIRNMASFTFSLAHRNNDMYYTQGLVKYKGTNSTATNTIWDVSFDTLLQNTPHLIHNHLSGTENIVIEDRANVLHSLSATGKTEFTVKIGEKIVGEIVNVDIMKNGKQQLLFVTPSKLHIIDLKGNYVSGFPVSLKDEPTSTPAVYDYEGDGNYRILIPAGKKILNYNKEGKPVTGFMFGGLPASITQAPEFTRIDNKDYLFICDEVGHVKITDRKGNDRYTVKFTLRNRGANAVYFEKGSTLETSKIIYCTNNGTIYLQYLNGMLDSLRSKTQIRNGYGFIDTDDDGTRELVVVDSSKIKWFDFKGQLIKEVTPFCADFKLQVYKAGHGLAVIGGTCKTDEVITAFDNLGNDVARIKLTADSPFTVADINHDNKFEIIYCYRNRIFVYTLR